MPAARRAIIDIEPATGGFTGHFNTDLVLWAIHRGAMSKQDMTHQLNFWPLMSLPMDEARARVALLPKMAETAA